MQRTQIPENPVEVLIPEVYDRFSGEGKKGNFSMAWSRKLRVKITGKDGFEKLDIRIPVSYTPQAVFCLSAITYVELVS